MSGCRLSGKAAIVTGGGNGIGRAVCQLFAKEGASVGVFDINIDSANETLKSLKNLGEKHCVIEADVTKYDDVKKAFEIAETRFGKKCSILVNCAGIVKPASLDDVTEKDFDDVINVNLKGTFLMSKEFIHSLKDSKDDIRGSVVNITSVAVRSTTAPVGYGAYGASKGGVGVLTKMTAGEFRKHKIRANSVMPGVIVTPMTKDIDKDETISRIPQGRLGRPEEVANAILFLASEESSYVNGACLEVDGGIRI